MEKLFENEQENNGTINEANTEETNQTQEVTEINEELTSTNEISSDTSEESTSANEIITVENEVTIETDEESEKDDCETAVNPYRDAVRISDNSFGGEIFRIKAEGDGEERVYRRVYVPINETYLKQKQEEPPKKRSARSFWLTITSMLLAICMITASFALGNVIGENKRGENITYTINQNPTPDYAFLVQNQTLERLDAPSVIAKLNPSVVDIYVSTPSGTGMGTGFIFTETGYIITCGHVIQDATSATVYLYEDDTPYPAEIIGFDTIVDIGVIKIDATGLRAVEIGESSKLVQGEEVVAIGTPYEMKLTHTATVGRVSGLRENYTLKSLGYTMDVIQHTAAINPGNSGGPLINMYGQVIGINSSKIMYDYSSVPYDDIGFAVAMDAVLPLIDDIINNGKVIRPQIGITGQSDFTIGGTVVRGFLEGGAAENSELQIGDIITHLNGVRADGMNVLMSLLGKYREGDEVELTVVRDGETFTMKITLKIPIPETDE